MTPASVRTQSRLTRGAHHTGNIAPAAERLHEWERDVAPREKKKKTRSSFAFFVNETLVGGLLMGLRDSDFSLSIVREVRDFFARVCGLAEKVSYRVIG